MCVYMHVHVGVGVGVPAQLQCTQLVVYTCCKVGVVAGGPPRLILQSVMTIGHHVMRGASRTHNIMPNAGCGL